MIRSFRHKGLKLLYDDDDPQKLNADHVPRLNLILTTLDAVGTVEETMSPSEFPPALRLHQLRGNLQGFWAVTVSANWRVIFRFVDGHIYDVDLVDYH